MIRRLRRKLAGLLWYVAYARTLRAKWPVPEAMDIDWTADDAAVVRAWWATDTGKKLWQLAREMEARNNATAVLSKQGVRDHTCGMAAGFRAGLAWMLTLSQPLPAPTEQGTTRAPDESTDESALRDRMSP